MERPIFSLDVETSGPLPGKHSLVSIGVHEILSGKGFYAELKPEATDAFEHGPMETISDKLLCLSNKERFELANGGGWKIAVDALVRDGETRKDAMFRLRKWMSEFANLDDYESYDVMAGPSSFDASFVYSAAGLSNVASPCKFSWICLSSVKRAVKAILPDWKGVEYVKSDVEASMSDDSFAKSVITLGIGKHNSYYDAVLQGLEYGELTRVLESLRTK